MVIVLLCILGLIVGSFINAAVWRLHSGESITHGRSMCPNCKHQLQPLDLVPVLSWLTLRGKCRYCQQPYGTHYVLVELMTAVLFGLSGIFMTNLGAVTFGLWIAILTMLIILALYDAQWSLLPDSIMNPALILGIVYFVLRFEAGSGMLQLVCALVVASVFYGAWWLSRGALMGGADSKLVLLMGLILTSSSFVLALALGFMLAGVGAAYLLYGKKKGMKDHMPFGPYLIAGCIIAQLVGSQLLKLVGF